MDKRLERILPRVQKPARYVGGEYNAVKKDPAQVDTRIAFCFPDTYEIGMSNLGMRILYGVMNNMDGVWCQRVFAPWGDMEEEMRRAGMPLFALESGEPITDFDIVAFSVGYEMAFPAILNMLAPVALVLVLLLLIFCLLARRGGYRRGFREGERVVMRQMAREEQEAAVPPMPHRPAPQQPAAPKPAPQPEKAPTPPPAEEKKPAPPAAEKPASPVRETPAPAAPVSQEEKPDELDIDLLLEEIKRM